MNITQALLDSLTEQAKANPRLRQSMDLRNSPDDECQRMLRGDRGQAPAPGLVISNLYTYSLICQYDEELQHKLTRVVNV